LNCHFVEYTYLTVIRYDNMSPRNNYLRIDVVDEWLAQLVDNMSPRNNCRWMVELAQFVDG